MSKYLLNIAWVVQLFFATGTTMMTRAQGREFYADFELLIFSQHIWRGEAIGNPLAIEPSVNFGKGNFNLNLWAATTFDGSYSEIDIIPSYNYKQFSFYFFDYYNPLQGMRNDYFTLKDGDSRHSFELAVEHQQTKKIPLNFFVGTFVFNDKNPDNGKPMYSTYLEASHRFEKWLTIEPSIGLTPFKSYYAENFAVVNCRLKLSREFKITKQLKIPLQSNAVYNPYLRNFSFNIATGFVLH
jgi:hypothetical protein